MQVMGGVRAMIDDDTGRVEEEVRQTALGQLRPKSRSLRECARKKEEWRGDEAGGEDGGNAEERRRSTEVT